MTSSADEVILISGKNLHFSLDEYARWLCLIEAIVVIDTKAKEINVDLDTNQDWVQPIALQKYIKERFLSMKYEIAAELGIEIEPLPQAPA